MLGSYVRTVAQWFAEAEASLIQVAVVDVGAPPVRRENRATTSARRPHLWDRNRYRWPWGSTAGLL